MDEMLGAARSKETRERWCEISPDFEAYVVEFLSGEIWSRPELDRRTRSLVTIATSESGIAGLICKPSQLIRSAWRDG